jgi:hypothetical protein
MFLYRKTNTRVSGRDRFYQGGGGETNPFCQEARRRDPSSDGTTGKRDQGDYGLLLPVTGATVHKGLLSSCTANLFFGSTIYTRRE